MLSSAPKSRCLSSWRLAHSSFLNGFFFSSASSQMLAVKRKRSLHSRPLLSLTACASLCLSSHLEIHVVQILSYSTARINPTHACSLTQTKETPTRLSAKHCLAASLLDPESLILHSRQINHLPLSLLFTSTSICHVLSLPLSGVKSVRRLVLIHLRPILGSPGNVLDKVI